MHFLKILVRGVHVSKTILFVCTGNTCRSIMAQALFKQLVSKQMGHQSTIKIQSAGLAAFPGDGASAHARQVLKEQGINVDDHRARMLTPEMVEDAALVLTMTMKHKETVRALVPHAEDKVFTLKEYCFSEEETAVLDVGDPYGLSRQAYLRVLVEFKEILPRLWQKIKEEV